ncbi:MAG: DUF4221 domain-containing protein [Thermoflexibacter sp.]|nr:DUF4221 domain-containing protein [Thermoflexibacter sp.]
MKKKIFYILIFPLCILLSCNSAEKPMITQYKEDYNMKIKEDSITISIDSSYRSFYGEYSYLKLKDILQFYGYNNFNHSIDVFSLSDLTVVKKIKLNKEGPNGITGIHSFFASTPDSLFIANENMLYLVSGDGLILKKWNITATLPKEFYQKNRHGSNRLYPIIYDKYQNAIYMRIFDYEYGYKSPDYGEKYKKPILARYDLKDAKFTILPVFYPKELQKNYKGYMQDMVCISPSFDKSNHLQKLYFTFGGSSNLSYYDVQKKEYIESGGASTMTENEIETLTWSEHSNEDKKMRHVTNEVNFMYTTFDFSTNLGYRFHLGKLPEGVTDMRNILLKKKLILTIFDANHTILKEIDFSNHRNVNLQSFFAVNGNLYIPIFDETHEDLLKFLIVKCHENNL